MNKNEKEIEILYEIEKAVIYDLKNGIPKKEIVDKFVHTYNFEEQTIINIINTIETQGYLIKRQNESNNIFFTILSIFIVYLVLNGIIYGVQEFNQRDNILQCETMESDLNSMKKEINSMEANLRNLEYENKEINRKISLTYNQSQYNKMVDTYNKNITSYDTIFKIYNKKIDKHNDLANEYNELAKTAYSRWWLFPFPVPSKKSSLIN
ncbi:hypothetical protein [Arcobacter vandammei]|uniref:hypothetical protein n=1 Tax=Arcobacter vandammei TaxID=2782243 RepID=UPI0018DF9068|nr:hypothetical protein [Arcobacter vandammei]